MTRDPRQLDPETLQAQTRSLRALARGLVADEHRVDDVVQQAWVTALQRKPRRGFSLGAWLAGITRNHARDDLRGQRRRAAHERRAAVAESRRDDRVERLDSLRNLLDHVRSLDEPYRSTVLRRFIDGSSARAIAKEDGIPLATVRTRIERALVRLRERLDRGARGDRNAWLVPLVPLAAGPQGGLPAPIADGLSNVARIAGRGAVGMSAKTQIVVCAVVLAGAIVTLFGVRGGPDDLAVGAGAIDDAVAESVSISRPPETTGLSRTPVREPVVTETSEAAAGGIATSTVRITGVVRDERGNPIVGATIDGSGPDVTTDAEGRYATSTSTRPGGSETWLNASAPAHAGARKIARIDGGASEVRLDFTLRRGFVIRGRVTDAGGAPMKGARVETFYASDTGVTTDEHGAYRLDQLDPGRPQHMLYARADGYLETRVDVATDGEEIEQDLVMHRGARVVGAVIGPGREPVRGAAMFIGFSPFAYDRLDATSSDDGRFGFPAVKPGRQKLVTQAPGFAADIRTIEVPDAGSTLEVEVELAHGHSAAGFVVDEAGKPLDGVGIAVKFRGMPIERHGTTDADGRFRLEDLPGEALLLDFYRTGYVRALLRDVGRDRSDLSVTLSRTARITGRVVDQRTGAPVPKFVIRFVPPELRDGETRGRGYSATWAREGHEFSSPDGVWDTGREDLAPGFITGIEVRASGYAPAIARRAIASTEPSPDDLRVGLEPGTELHGRVLADDTAEPIAGATVKVARAHNPLDLDSADDTHGRAMTRTDANGRFAFPHLAAGDLHLAIEHPDWGLTMHAVTIPQGFAELVENVRLDSQGSIRGTARDAAGNAVAGVDVGLVAIEIAGVDRKTWRATTDAAGGFAFAHLPDGAYRLARLEPVGDTELERDARYVRIERESARTIELTPPAGVARVRGRLAAEVAFPATVRVRLSRVANGGDWESRFVPRTVLAEDGAFEFAGLAPGRYRVSASFFDRSTMTSHRGSTEIDVRGPADEPLELPLEARPID